MCNVALRSRLVLEAVKQKTLGYCSALKITLQLILSSYLVEEPRGTTYDKLSNLVTRTALRCLCFLIFRTIPIVTMATPATLPAIIPAIRPLVSSSKMMLLTERQISIQMSITVNSPSLVQTKLHFLIESLLPFEKLRHDTPHCCQQIQ